MTIVSICVWLLATMFLVEASNIIFNGMHASPSHTGSMMPLATRLSKDGHKVHFLESNTKPTAYKYPPGITHTYLQLKEDPFFAKAILPAMWEFFYGPAEFPPVWNTGDKALVEMIEEHYDKFAPVANASWDLVIADELFAVTSYGLAMQAKKRNNTFILLTTCASTHIMRWHFAYGSPPIHRPSFFTPVGRPFEPENFSSRLHVIIHYLWINLGVEYVTTYSSVKGLKLMGQHDFHLSKLAHDTSYYFVDDLNSFVWPYPVASDLIHVGYYCPSAGELPEDYREFLEDPTSKGTIMIAFGTNVLWKLVPDNIMDAFVHGINNLTDYRIVFAFNGHEEQVKRIGSHCKVTSWAPQKEVLLHHKTKLFISHGGMKSLKDTICGKVPVVYMPLFAEQPHNAELARQAGFAEILLKTELTAEKFLNTVKTVAETPKYKKAVERFNSFYLDRPVPSLDLGAFYARRALKIRTRNPTFKIRAMFMNTFSYFYGELWCILIALVYVLSR